MRVLFDYTDPDTGAYFDIRAVVGAEDIVLDVFDEHGQKLVLTPAQQMDFEREATSLAWKNPEYRRACARWEREGR